MATVIVALISVVIAVIFTFALPELVSLLNAASTSAGVPSSLQSAVGAVVDIMGIIVVVVMAGLFYASISVFKKG